MFQEWMLGVPLLLSGSEFSEYNARQLATAKEYEENCKKYYDYGRI